jgi:Putative transposase
LQSEGAAFGLSLAGNGNVVVELKSPYSDGTTNVVLNPMEFIGRLVSLVPRPRAILTRFHGVLFWGGLPSNGKLRKRVIPEKPVPVQDKAEGKAKGYGMSWAQRLKRVFAIEIGRCDKCGGNVKVIASIEEPAVIERILKHLGRDGAAEVRQPGCTTAPRRRLNVTYSMKQ